jgi:hypothetical protein
LEETIQAVQQKMAELATEMALLKEEQQKTQIVRWVPYKYKVSELGILSLNYTIIYAGSKSS